VDSVCSIKLFLQKTILEGGWRIVLVDGVDALNVQGANALLKVLEAPPHLDVVNGPDLRGVLATVRSRCQTLVLKPLTHDLMVAGLEHFGFSAAQGNLPTEVFPLSSGCLGLALNLLTTGLLQQVLVLKDLLTRACLPKEHADYQGLVIPENIQALLG